MHPEPLKFPEKISSNSPGKQTEPSASLLHTLPLRHQKSYRAVLQHSARFGAAREAALVGAQNPSQRLELCRSSSPAVRLRRRPELTLSKPFLYNFEFNMMVKLVMLNRIRQSTVEFSMLNAYGGRIGRRSKADLCKVGKLDKAKDVANDTKAWGISPNVVAYKTLIDGLCKMGGLGKMYEVDAVLTEMVSNNVRPSQLDEAGGLLDEVLGLGVKPNVVTYNAPYKCILSSGFNDIRNQRFAPSLNMLVDACCKDGLMEKANVLRSLMLEGGIFPTLWHYCRITDLCRQGNVEIAMKILHEMEVKGLEVNLINQEGNLRSDLNVREQVEKQCARANVAVYDVLIIGYCAKGKLEDVNELLNEMLEKGLIVKLLTK
ncbi:hypothetical protein ACFX2I_010224 [Malus domestica]|nr:pentatricopeptide repeat-containing protein At1g09820-like [Malus domestica]